MQGDHINLSSYDEGFYEIAINELKSGQFSEPLWFKALAKSEFDESKARGVYVQLRVEQLKTDIYLKESAAEIDKMQKELENEKKKLDKQKSELIIQNVMESPFFLIQTLLIASVAGSTKSLGRFLVSSPLH